MAEYYELSNLDQDLQSEENKLVRKSLTRYPEPYLSGLKLNADVEINGLTLNTIDEDGVVWVVSDIDGWWNLPESELPDLPRGWGDGSYEATGRFSTRILTLSGSFLTQDPDQAPVARQKLLEAIKLVKTGGWLIVNEGPKKAAYVRLSGAPQVDSASARGRHNFSIGLVANDPVKYEWNDSDIEGYNISSITTGTAIANTALYQGTASPAIVNNGSTPVPIIIEIPDGITVTANSLPYILNETTDERITLTTSTVANTRLEIDTYNREVLDVTYVTRAISNVTSDLISTTYTTTQNHGLSVGDIVDVTGITPSSLDVERAEVVSKTDTTFTVGTPLVGTYDSGGEVDVITVVSNGRSKVSVLIDWIYLEPGANTLKAINFPQDTEIKIYYRSGWLS